MMFFASSKVVFSLFSVVYAHLSGAKIVTNRKMSSSHPPPDCALQLPSWDEFDQTEELDNSESDHEPDERGSQRPTAIGPTLPPGACERSLVVQFQECFEAHAGCS